MAIAVEDNSKVAAILEQLDRLSSQAPGVNRRQAKRVKFQGNFWAYPAVPGTPSPVRVISRDLSTSGLGLLTRASFQRGQRLVVILDKEGMPARTLLARVAFSRSLGGGMHQVGVEFLDCIRSAGDGSSVPQKWLTESQPTSAPAAPAFPAPHAPAPVKPARPIHAARRAPAEDCPRLLSREKTLERLQLASRGKCPAGVAAQVHAAAASSQTDVADVVNLVQSDPMLASRVLQLANAAAGEGRGKVRTLAEAARLVGLQAIQQTAGGISVFDASFEDEADGFNLMRCWQHSSVVGQLMAEIARLGSPELEGIYHLAGLCHDQADIFLRQQFRAEYGRINEFAQKQRRNVEDVEGIALGVRRGEMIEVMLKAMHMPAEVIASVRTYCEKCAGIGGRTTDAAVRRMALALEVANLLAHGLLLAPSGEASVSPLARGTWESVAGKGATLPLNAPQKRATLVVQTQTLAQLRDGQGDWGKPLIPRMECRMGYVRGENFVDPDPLRLALELCCDVTMLPTMPVGAQWKELDALVVAGGGPGTEGPTRMAEVCAAAGRSDMPVLLLGGTPGIGKGEGNVRVRGLAMRLLDLRAWLQEIAPARETIEVTLDRRQPPPAMCEDSLPTPKQAGPEKLENLEESVEGDFVSGDGLPANATLEIEGEFSSPGA